MSVRLSILACALAACTSSTTPPDPCEAPVATGEYAVSIVPMINLRAGYRFEMAADGSFEGFSDNMAYTGNYARCTGTLTPAEHDALTAAINDARGFCIESWAERGADAYSYDVTLRASASASENRFCGFSDYSHPDFDAIMGVVGGALRRVEMTGPCGEPMYEVGFSTDLCPLPRR